MIVAPPNNGFDSTSSIDGESIEVMKSKIS